MTTEMLIHRVWDEPPANARRTLHVLIANLRRLLRDAGDQVIETRSGGYRLQLPAGHVDMVRFRLLVAEADTAAAGERRRELLQGALALWRGEPLAGLRGAWAQRTREALTALRVDAVAAWSDAEAGLGRPMAAFETLTELIDGNPYVETLPAALMRALSAAGRTAEALDLYTRTRRRLADELGTDPGGELQAVHREVLAGRPAASGSVPAELPASVPSFVGRFRERAEPDASSRPRPAQLPADVSGFAGRAAELSQLDCLLPGAEPRDPVVVAAVTGMAGVGKTSLAIRWAHRVADRSFPDGQLYADMRGFDTGGQPQSAEAVLRGFLDALGVSAEQVPPAVDEQAALYRSLLAGRRILVVLDNARDAAQVRPLLPGATPAAAIITSRNRLTGLVSTLGAYPVNVDVLSEQDAVELLRRRLGTQRVAAVPEAVAAILAATSRLPLALAIIAARVQSTGFSLAAVAAELVTIDDRLDALDAGESAGGPVRAVFGCSYAVLSPAAARLFRLVGLHPGVDLNAAVAASLAGVPVAQARKLLAELVRAGLLAEHRPGRFVYHDLLQAYAGELVDRHETPGASRAALTRMLDHYAHTAFAANRLIHPTRDPIPVPPAEPAAGAVVDTPRSRSAAMAWFAAEHANLLICVQCAADAEFTRHSWQLAWALDTYLYRQGHWHDYLVAWRAALVSADRAGDAVALAAAHRMLGHGHLLLRQYDECRMHLGQARGLYAKEHDHLHLARTLMDLSVADERQGRWTDSRRHAEQALNHFRVAGHRAGEAGALNAFGWCDTQLGHPAGAMQHCGRALILLEQIGDVPGQAHTWDTIGYAYHELGQHECAAACYLRAVTLFRQLDNRYHEADSLTHLGDARFAGGDLPSAADAWKQSLEILAGLDHPDAAGVRDRLYGRRPH